jgi:16S rRNA (guanine527-N7)-methyltransferase
VADSLSGLEIDAVREAGTIADIGSGAGFPGLVLAVARPEARVDLIESAGRKCAVIDRLRAVAGVDNARVLHARAEEWAAADGSAAYDAVTARAVAPLAVLCEYAAPLLHADGALVCWKGARDAGEEEAGSTAASALGLELAEVRRVVPFPRARHRHLHVFVKVAPTPARFPRRAGAAAKRPLAA